MSMIAATYTQGGVFAVESAAVPEIAADEILIKVQAASICGTDARIVRNGHRKLSDGQKIILGHEFSGVIERVGKRVEGYAAGQRVGVAPNYGCGRCGMCIRGLTNMCPDYRAFGIMIDGAHAEYVRVPRPAVEQGNLVVLPEGIPPEHATLIEPLSCVVNGLNNARVDLGDTVVIFGAGAIGLFHVMLAYAMGAARVIVVDPVEARLARARELGAETLTTDQDTNARLLAMTGGGANVVVTACSVPSVQEQALELLAPFGRLSLFGGLPKDSATVTINSNLIHYKNLFVTGMTGGSLADFRAAMRMIAAGRIDVDKVISHKLPMSRMQQAYEVMLSGDCLKVVLLGEN